MACDASAYGVGAVISHVMPDSSEQPIAYGSRTLSTSEQNYSQLEKEAPAIIFGIKFHKFLYGRPFTLVTDHKPLVIILGPRSPVPTIAAARLQRWALLLSGYQYQVEFHPTAQHGNADCLSRLPICQHQPDALPEETPSLFNISQIHLLPVRVDQLRQASVQDPLLSRVLNHIVNDWPSSVDPKLRPYFQRQNQLTTEAGCILCGIRVLIPSKLRKQVPDELHTSHPRIVRMKSLDRLHMWWPGIDTEIELLVRHCTICQSIWNSQLPTTLHPWAWPNRPWQQVHLDFTGPFLGHMYLLMVDAHSKWLEVIMMTSTTAEKTITELRKVFTSYGLPEQLVTDNGPQFTSSDFDVFIKCNGIKHILTAPYHPKSNGEAERAVQTFKNGLLAQRMEKDEVQTKLSRFLMSYRNTPHSTTGVTPVELFLKRKVRTRLDLLRPNIAERVSQNQATAKQNSDKKARPRDFEVGEAVFVENLIKQGQPKWLPSTIVEKVGSVMYRVQVNDET